LYYYYSYFGIEIYNYISASEVVMAFMPVILLTALTLATSPVFFMLGMGRGRLRPYKNPPSTIRAGSQIPSDSNSIASEKAPKFFWPFVILSVAVVVILLACNYFLIKRGHHHTYEFKDLFATLYLALGISIMLITASNNRSEDNAQYYYIYVIALTLAIGQTIKYYRVLAAEEVRTEGNTTILMFNYKGRLFTSDKNRFPIGETQTHLFFYNRTDSTSIILDKKDVDSIVVIAH
jgi:hypothetical protein